MHSKWRWLLLQLTRQLWLRATLFAALGVVTALFGVVLDPFAPRFLTGLVTAEAVRGVLDILASSMLAVTTFSLSVMVSAYAAASSDVSPRATRLVMRDTTSQNVLATFLGSFLFSLIGIVALSVGAYGEGGRALLFLVTLVVIVVIAGAILRWIDLLSRLGRVGETVDTVERATLAAIETRLSRPYLGGRPQGDESPPEDALPISTDRIGYVQFVDIEALSRLAEEHDVEIRVGATPGAFVHDKENLAWVLNPGDAEADMVERDLRSAFVIEKERTFEQDPRFGVCVLAEIASRALSPGLNDAGTAIDVIGRMVRLLTRWSDACAETDAAPVCERILVPPLRTSDLFDDAFTPIARDGAGIVEVQIRLQKALAALHALGGEENCAACRRHSELALAQARQAMTLDAHRERVEAAAKAIAEAGPDSQASAVAR